MDKGLGGGLSRSRARPEAKSAQEVDKRRAKLEEGPDS